MPETCLGSFEVLDITENQDGSGSITIASSPELRKNICALFNWKRMSKKRWQQIITDATEGFIQNYETSRCSTVTN